MFLLRKAYTFRVPVLQGKQRPRHGNGNTYTPQETKDAQEAIAMAYVAAAKSNRPAPAFVPVLVHVHIYRPLMAKTARDEDVWAEWDFRKPDVDNVLKTVMDALEGVAYTDDRQVVEGCVYRHMATREQDRDEMEVQVIFPSRWDERWNQLRDLKEV